MRLRWILTAFILIVISAVVLLFWQGLNPKTVALINLSNFKNPEAVSEAVLKRLAPQLTPELSMKLYFDANNLFHQEVAKELAATRPKVSFANLQDDSPFTEKQFNIFLTEFPRSRKEEAAFQWCPEKNYQQWQCVLIPKVRSLYRKRLSPGIQIGFFDQVGRNEFVLALTLEKVKEP